MDGGFVRQNCTKCGRPHLLSKHEFFDRLRCAVDCPHCGDRMLKVYVGNNYGFQCPTCHGTLLLADIVPWYYDLAPLKTERVMASAMVQ